MIDLNVLNSLSSSSFIKKIKGDLQKNIIPYSPIVTQADAKSGYITRHFIRNANYLENLTEISKTTYDELKDNSLYVTTKVKWKIVGKIDTIVTSSGANIYGVIDLNKKAVFRADLTFGGLSSYIYDYLEFWIGENI